jgi:hypothetical protein
VNVLKAAAKPLLPKIDCPLQPTLGSPRVEARGWSSPGSD